jgi:hypothetical protein
MNTGPQKRIGVAEPVKTPLPVKREVPARTTKTEPVRVDK